MSEQIHNEQRSVCCECGKAEVSACEMEYRDKLVLDRHEYDVAVPKLPVRRCDACGAVYFGSQADRLIDEALRGAAGLLTASQIGEARRALGIREQQELADLVGVASASLSRWMKGHVVQSRLADTVLRVFFAVPEARDFLRTLKEEGPHAVPLVVPDRGTLITRRSGWVNAYFTAIPANEAWRLDPAAPGYASAA